MLEWEFRDKMLWIKFQRASTNIIAESSRQYQNVRICDLHIDLGKLIINRVTKRNLRLPCKLLSLEIDGTVLAKISFREVVDLLNELGRDLTIVKLTGLNDQLDDCHDLVLINMKNVRHLELCESMKLSSKSLDVLCNGFHNLKTLKLSIRLYSVKHEIQVVQTLFQNNAESLENLTSHFFCKPIEHLRNLKNITTPFTATQKSLEVDVLKSCTKLKSFRIRGSYISNENLLKIPKYFTELSDVKINLARNVDVTSLCAIAELPNLKASI